jgi:uncharacterized phiE125 gp8 family phage protein
MARRDYLFAPKVNRVSGPASEPVTVTQAKDHCELLASDTTHDAKLTRYIAAARQRIENETSYVLMTQTYTLSFDAFPDFDKIKIPKRPVSSVSSISYYDADNSQQTLGTDVYGVDTSRMPFVYLKYNQSWPTITEQHGGCTIQFNAGFGTADQVPSILKHLILVQVGSWFYDRGDVPDRDWSMAYDRLWRTVQDSAYP